MLYECPLEQLKPALDFPPNETELPSDLMRVSSDETDRTSIQEQQGASVHDIHSKNIGSFGRQIQAISFLIKVLQCTDESNNTPLSELISLDGELQEFLSVLMAQSSQRHTCGANGIIIR